MPFQRWRSRKKSEAQTGLRLYEYRPLQASNIIRVLEVSQAGSMSGETNVLTLRLKHVDLTPQSNYAAISYMWSPPPTTEELVIDGRALRVRAGVGQMIYDLSKEHQSRLLWIDAICINQQDDKERSAQVMLMGEIYSRANQVIAYVKGSDHPKYRAAYESGIGRRYLSLFSTIDCIRDAVIKKDMEALRKDLDYERYFDNNYFTRRWVIQEICLARSVIIHCDGNEISMGLLEDYFTMFGAEHGYAQSRAANICALRRQMLIESSKLEDLLYDHEGAICSDRLDRVYALLSLSESRGHIQVEYNIAPLSLLVSVLRTACWYEQLNNLRVLSFACFLRRHLEIPFSDFEQGRCNLDFCETETDDLQLSACVQVRSFLHGSRIDPVIEDGLNRLRSHLPALRNYPEVQLTNVVMSEQPNDDTIKIYEFNQREFIGRKHEYMGARVDAINLWAFSCTSSLPTGEPPSYKEAEISHQGEPKVLAGLSSGMTQVNDEVWQFPRTPVALIARKTDTGYRLVARALMLTSNAWRPDGSIQTALARGEHSIQLGNILDWTKGDDDALDPAHTRMLAMRTKDLLGMMKWADTFAD